MQPAPPPPPRRHGLRRILLILGGLFLVGLGLLGWQLYDKWNLLTGAAAATVPVFDGGDEMYQAASDKLRDFSWAVDHHRAAALRLSADEINTLIARSPQLTKHRLRLFFTFGDASARVQASFPLGTNLNVAFLKNRYFNGEITVHPTLDPADKSIHFVPEQIVMSGQTLTGQQLLVFQTGFDLAFNNQLQKQTRMRAALDQARRLAVEHGELVLEIN